VRSTRKWSRNALSTSPRSTSLWMWPSICTPCPRWFAPVQREFIIFVFPSKIS
jgi:hypothetical protein